MSVPDPHLLVLVAALAGAGCASTAAPAGWLPSPDEARRSAHGGWIELEMPDRRVEGELIAVGEDSLYVLPPDGVLSVLATGDVEGVRLAFASNDPGPTAAWGLLGTVSTLSHGFFFVLSGPVWLITTGVTASVESGAHRLRSSRGGWEAFAPYARFPQGLPAGLDRRRLRPN